MAAIRAKWFLGVVFVWSSMLGAAYSFAAAKVSGEGTAEEIPAPAATEQAESTAPSEEGANLVTQQCDETGCTFEGVPLCSPPGRFWVRADWMMWWTSGTALPPLVVAGPPDTPATQIEVVYGDQTVLTGGRSAVRMTIGGWIDACHRWGIEADWLTLSGASSNFSQTGTSTTIVGRPLFDLEHNELAYELADFVNVNESDNFSSTGVWVRYNLCCCGGCGECGASCDSGCSSGPDCGVGCNPCGQYYCRTDLLVGYRNYVLGDRLTINESETSATPVPTNFAITDSFRTRNEFNGNEIGLSTDLHRGRWGLNVLAKMAVGNTHQKAYINGFTRQTVTQNGQTVVTDFNNGIYATLSNINTYTKDQFTVIPQLAVEMSYQLTCRIRGFVGYNLLYWSPVWHAGDQIDLFIDPRNFAPTPSPDRLPLPTFPGQNSSFWAQGLNLGLEMRF
jgi:hypothetical protein